MSVKKEFTQADLRLNLFTLVIIHIQLILGLAWYFMSPAYKHVKEIGMGAAMKDAHLRLLTVEHPTIMILAIIFITIGFVKHKTKQLDSAKFKAIAFYYSISLLLILSRIPWGQWFE
jgi:hypothetical protein